MNYFQLDDQSHHVVEIPTEKQNKLRRVLNILEQEMVKKLRPLHQQFGTVTLLDGMRYSGKLYIPMCGTVIIVNDYETHEYTINMIKEIHAATKQPTSTLRS